MERSSISNLKLCTNLKNNLKQTCGVVIKQIIRLLEIISPIAI